jgi:flagellar protein FlaF
MSQKKPPQPNNPHAAAAGAYGDNAQAHTPNQREVEARVLLKAANAFQTLKDNWDKQGKDDLDTALSYNKQIWLMFVDTAMEDNDPNRPIELRNNIANLGLFIFKHTIDVLAKPEKNKLDILIEINREIAAGLMESKAKAEDGKSKEKATPKESEISADIVG